MATSHITFFSRPLRWHSRSRLCVTPSAFHLPSRPLTISSRRATENHNPQKAALEDREKINTDANEYAKSGTDDTAAQNDEAAFDPNITDPQHAKKKAGEGNKVNPLDASPANPDISQPTVEEGGRAKKKIGEGDGGR